jgi:hypothetical protein
MTRSSGHEPGTRLGLSVVTFALAQHHRRPEKPRADVEGEPRSSVDHSLGDENILLKQ